MNDFMIPLTIWLLLTTYYTRATQTSSYIKSSVTLYNQSLYAFSTKVSTLTNKTRIYDNYAWNYSLKNNITAGLIDPVQEVTFPEGITANVFSFGNATSFPSLMAFGQVTKGELLSEGELGSTFFSYNDNQWVPDTTLSANGPSRRTGSSLMVCKNRLIIFGGIIINPNFYNRMLSRQLYSFDANTQKWSDLTSTAAVANIPPMAYHTATLVKDRYMVIIGGAVNQSEHDRIPDNTSDDLKSSPSYLSKVFVFDLEINTWMIHYTSNFPSYSFMDHSASYIPHHKAIVVLGGADERIYERNKELLLLNVDDWSWSKVTLVGDNLTDTPRFWRASYLVENQLFIMFGGVSRKFAMNYLVVDAQTWNCTNEINAAPVSSLKSEEPDDTDPTSPRDVKLILGSTLGAVGGAAVALILVLLYRRIKRWRRRKKDYPTTNLRQPFYLTPVWSGDAGHQASELALNSSLWEMDSHYAYSTRQSITPHRQHPSHYYYPLPSLTSHGTICPRRWSADLHRPSPKQLTEIAAVPVTSKDDPSTDPLTWSKITSTKPRHPNNSTTYDLLGSSTRIATSTTNHTTLL